MDSAPERISNPIAFLRGSQEGERLDAIGVTVYVKVTQEESGGAFSLFETCDSSAISGPPLHIHHRENESMLVLEGAYQFQIREAIQSAGAGVLAHVPMGVPHTCRCVSETGRLLVLTTPGGYEAFFRGMVWSSSDRLSPRHWMFDRNTTRLGVSSQRRVVRECTQRLPIASGAAARRHSLPH
jgi:quercetin dioxygenase-like cupin family protein